MTLCVAAVVRSVVAAADLLRDLGVFSLLRVSPDTAEPAIVSNEDGVERKTAEKEVPRMGSIPAPERPVVLDLIDVEVFAFTDRSGNFLPDVDASGGTADPVAVSTPGKDGDGWF